MRKLARPARAAIGHIGEALAKSLRQAQRSWARLPGDARGNVALMFGFCAIGLVGGVGIAIDTSVAYNVKSRLGAAVDAAALAGARAFANPNRDADIANFFDANFPDDYMRSVLQPLEIVEDNENRTITVTARATIPTFFMSVLGTDSTDISATAQATLSSRDVEVALVLDVTGSMQYDMDALRDAANELVDIVVQDQQEPFYSKVALIPYSAAVNVGDYAESLRGTYTNNTCTEPTCRYFRFFAYNGTWATHEISTCVTERPGPDLSTDAAPNLAPLGRAHLGTGNRCLAHQILPLSSNKTELHNRINALTHGGSTAGHIGVAWGWYMISPNFGYLWPAESQPKQYGEIHLGQKVMKVVIIMTDGEFNTIYHSGVIAKNSTGGGASGSSAEKINQNATNGSSFSQAATLCTNMKAEGVIVYTVGFANASTGAAATFVTNCATDAGHVYLPSTGTELKQAFRDIAVQVSNLRISM
ncbi:MAG: pilus assembly protein TadG-related protein [Kiloniellaceae bacterium]